MALRKNNAGLMHITIALKSCIYLFKNNITLVQKYTFSISKLGE